MFLFNTLKLYPQHRCVSLLYSTLVCVNSLKKIYQLLSLQDQRIQKYTFNPLRYVGFIKKNSLPFFFSVFHSLRMKVYLCELHNHSSHKQFRSCFFLLVILYTKHINLIRIYFICTMYLLSTSTHFISRLATKFKKNRSRTQHKIENKRRHTPRMK